ncbi:melanoma-associated antigen 10-like [Saccopteryx leptura]|uniref:melanoma-associated antigen 10-like n=1 Tax=Saccopteryx leptura TaxID=249018 RepID=UPI00339BD2BF
MPRAPKRRRVSDSDAQRLVDAQGDTSSTSSTCSSSLPSSFSYSSSSSCCLLISSNSSTSEESRSSSGTDNLSQSPLTVGLSPTAHVTPLSQSSSQEEAGPSTMQSLPDTEFVARYVIDNLVSNLVGFLLLKYRKKELTTKAEMLSSITKEYQNHFAIIFREALECAQLVYGIDMKEVDPTSQSYVLVTNLGLTYDGLVVGNEHSMPKTGLLILVLSMIFMEGNCVSEDKIWEALSVMGVYPGQDHCIYGEPWELITKNWVQEQYLECRRVPNSQPTCYEFLWGPRAHAETSKMEVLKFLAQIDGSDPRSFPGLYEEALKDEEQKSQARIGTTDDTVMASTSSCPE